MSSLEDFPRTNVAEQMIKRWITNDTKTVTFTTRTSRRRHLEYSWLSSVVKSDVAVGWDPMEYVPSRWLSLYPLDPSALRHDPYWTGIKFLRRPLNCHQDYVADSSAYASLSHDPTATPFIHQQHQDMWFIVWLTTLTIRHDSLTTPTTLTITWSPYCAMGSGPLAKACLY